jgi:cbb3-type cytochrome oxidase maturation protein
MNILLVLIPVTALVIGIAIALFFWAVNHQQFDDLDSPGMLPLLDDPDQGVAPAPVASSATPDSPVPEGKQP